MQPVLATARPGGSTARSIMPFSGRACHRRHRGVRRMPAPIGVSIGIPLRPIQPEYSRIGRSGSRSYSRANMGAVCNPSWPPHGPVDPRHGRSSRSPVERALRAIGVSVGILFRPTGPEYRLMGCSGSRADGRADMRPVRATARVGRPTARSIVPFSGRACPRPHRGVHRHPVRTDPTRTLFHGLHRNPSISGELICDPFGPLRGSVDPRHVRSCRSPAERAHA